MAIAGGIAAGLLQRATTGEAPVVDVSLLGWPCGSCRPTSWPRASTAATRCRSSAGAPSPNPLVGSYRTSDDRFITLMMLQSDRFWPEFCEYVGRPDLITDHRFADGGARFANREECVAEHRRALRLQDLRGVEGAAGRRCRGSGPRCQMASELVDDPLVTANGYLARVDRDDGKSYDLVANPVQMDETADQLRAAPEHGQHTEEILLELGLDWDAIIAHKEAGAIL